MILKIKEDRKSYVHQDSREEQFHYVNSAKGVDGHWDILVRNDKGELKHFPSQFMEVVTKLDVVLK